MFHRHCFIWGLHIISLNYGLNLAKNLVNEGSGIPIIGSIINIGNENEIISAIEKLSETGIAGLELNFSCPNVKILKEGQSILTNELLRKIRKTTSLPISLKLTPYDDYFEILQQLDGEIDGLTLSNAYIGLFPPEIDGAQYSPFRQNEFWAPCGIYGPFERLLTFYQLYKYRKLADEKNLSIACVGGVISKEDVLQSILLGADVVQLSSAIAWNGIHTFYDINSFLIQYFQKNRYSDINSIKGQALPYIKQNSNELPTFKSLRKMRVDQTKCKRCRNCICCDRLCLAISQDVDGIVKIDKNLCSGCAWCFQNCMHGAIVPEK